MDTRHFYGLWQSNDDGFPIRQFGTLPEFCKPSLKEGDPSTLTYLDGWEVEASGDADADLETGRRYAEITVSYARNIGSPAFITFVLDNITLKSLINGGYGTIETGFFERLAQISYCGSTN